MNELKIERTGNQYNQQRKMPKLRWSGKVILRGIISILIVVGIVYILSLTLMATYNLTIENQTEQILKISIFAGWGDQLEYLEDGQGVVLRPNDKMKIAVPKRYSTCEITAKNVNTIVYYCLFSTNDLKDLDWKVIISEELNKEGDGQ